MTLRKSEKVDIKNENSEESESRVLEEAEVCIIRMTEEIRKWNTDESIKNEFFSSDASFFSITLFLKSRDSEEMRRSQLL